MRKQVMELQKELVTRDVCEGLTESQVVKIKSLAEGVDFESNEDLKEKLETIKETYFGNTEVISEDTSFDDQEPVELDEEVQPSVHPGMRSYMDAISRTVKK
jgi:hypothetical protein